jgi:CobQ-like glutamine amidotransferase family enzyme
MGALRFDAVLKEWWIVAFCDGIAVVGQIYGDTKRRFPDGRWIMTSTVLTPRRNVVSGNIIRTRNSRYLLVGATN